MKHSYAEKQVDVDYLIEQNLELVRKIAWQIHGRARNITENKDGAQSDFITERQGDYDPGDDFASGGIARLLGE